VAVPNDEGGTDPGLIVGTRVSLPLAGEYDLYLVYSLASEQRIVSLASRNITIGGLGFLAILIVVVWAFTRWVLSPVRHTARAAERLASGLLAERLSIQGEDEISTLARSFNHMATSLEDQIERLESLSKVQRLFVSDVSHELRTPLASIRLATEQIQDAREEISDPFALRSIQVLSNSVDRFETMLTDLLDISRIDSGQMTIPSPAVPITLDDVRTLQEARRRVYVHETLKAYIVDIINTTRGAGPNPLPGWKKHVRVGASPRGGIAFMQIAQALALRAGRNHVMPDDIKEMRYGILRHRIIRTFDAMADNVSIEGLIDAVFKAVPVP